MRWIRRLIGDGVPLIQDVQPPSAVHVEGEDRLHATRSLDRLAIVAHWAPDARVGRSPRELVGALVANGYEVLFVSAAPGAEPLDWASGRPPPATILRRPNVGYDFGSWGTALQRYPWIGGIDQVLLVNDSLIGPFGPMDHLLEQFDGSRADVWGLTDTTQFTHHLQSYCLGFKGGCLNEGPLARFWRTVRAEDSRDAVIMRNEIGLARLLARERFVTEAAIPYWRLVAEGQNPTIMGWRRLLDHGFPFVKRQLLLHPDLAPDGRDARAVIEGRFGIGVDAWLS